MVGLERYLRFFALRPRSIVLPVGPIGLRPGHFLERLAARVQVREAEHRPSSVFRDRPAILGGSDPRFILHVPVPPAFALRQSQDRLAQPYHSI